MKRLLRLFAIVMFVLAGLLASAKVLSGSSIGAACLLSIVLLAGLALLSGFACVMYDTTRLPAQLWLSTVVSTIVYIVTDVVLGLFFVRSTDPPIEPDRYSHHRFVADTTTTVMRPEFEATFTVNHFGFRGPNVSVAKDKGVYRILMLGDSFTAGWGVKDNETFSSLLETALNANVQRPSDFRIEVINGGVDSYCPILEHFALVQRLGRFDPDLVILNFDMSDLVQEAVYRKVAVYKNDDMVGIDGYQDRIGTDGSSTLLSGLRNWIDRHLLATRWIVYYLDRLNGLEENVTNVVRMAYPDLVTHTLVEDQVDRSEQWHNIFDSVGKVKDDCDRLGATFVLAVYPWGHQVNDDEWAIGRTQFMRQGAPVSDRSLEVLRDFANNKGIPWLDTFPAFRSYRGGAPLYFEKDLHWTPAGHQLMAAELEHFLETTNWVVRQNCRVEVTSHGHSGSY